MLNDEYLGQVTQVLSNRALNEIKVGKTAFGLNNTNLTSWSNHWQKANGITNGGPRITFTGFLITGNQNYPRHIDMDVWSVRDDFTFSFTMRGRHDLKTGGEFLTRKQVSVNCRQCMGLVDARGGPVPANIEALFPDPFNVDTWNLAALSSITRSYTIGVGNVDVPVHDEKDRRVDPGRLADCRSTDVEPRRPLRRRDRAVCERHQLPAVPGRRTSR